MSEPDIERAVAEAIQRWFAEYDGEVAPEMFLQLARAAIKAQREAVLREAGESQ